MTCSIPDPTRRLSAEWQPVYNLLQTTIIQNANGVDGRLCELALMAQFMLDGSSGYTHGNTSVIEPLPAYWNGSPAYWLGESFPACIRTVHGTPYASMKDLRAALAKFCLQFSKRLIPLTSEILYLTLTANDNAHPLTRLFDALRIFEARRRLMSFDETLADESLLKEVIVSLMERTVDLEEETAPSADDFFELGEMTLSCGVLGLIHVERKRQALMPR